MNNHLYESSWTSLLGRFGLGLFGCVLLVLAVQTALEESTGSAASAASVSPQSLHQSERYQSKKIEDVEVGDYVLSRDETTGEFASKPVLEVYRRISDHLRILEIKSLATGETQRIETTDEHPFWVPGSGWVNAGKLQPQDELTDSNGNAAIVLTSNYQPHPAGVKVYNFQVADYHSYHVRAGNTRGPPVWVHNANYKPKAPKRGVPRRGDMDKGPHGPKRPIQEVIDRAYDTGNTQGRWISSDAARRAAAKTDMTKGAQHISIDPGDGIEIIPLPNRGGVLIREATQAFAQPKGNVVHTFPVGPNHKIIR